MTTLCRPEGTHGLFPRRYLLSIALSELGFKRDWAEWTWGMKPGDAPEIVGRRPITVFLRSDKELPQELDVMTYMADVGGYDDVVTSCKTVQIGGISISMAAIEMIKRSKEYLNRPKDQDRSAMPSPRTSTP